jgi:Transglycosylase-like domain
MRRLVVVTAAFFAAGVGAPAAAVADMKPDCSTKLVKSAKHHRNVVVKKHSVRTAGRDIVKYGVIRRNQHPSPAKCGEIRRYRNQLVVLHTEPKYHPLIVRTAVKPYRAPAGAMTPSAAAPAGGTLAAIRACESGGNYSTNTGNGFYGAYQFTQSTWNSVGGVGNPAAASPAEQDKRAAILYAREGASPWPVCGR